MNDTVDIDIEGNFDLRNTSSGRCNTCQLEVAQCLVVGSHRSFTLQYVDIDSRLIIGSRREDLRLLRRDRCITRNQYSHDTA